MKQLVFAVIAVLSCSLARGEEGYHIFTDTTGRAISARILTYDARKQVMLVQMENGRQGKIPLAQLSDADKEYVQAWNKARDFMSESRFKISAERNREEDDSSSGHKGNKELSVREVCYEITLDNRSDTEFSGVKIEYCIFYEQEDFKASAGEVVCDQGVICGTVDVGAVAARSDHMYKTDVVKVFKEELDSGWSYVSGSDNVKHGEVHGLWVRASIELPGGDRIVREYCLPDSLSNSYKWTTSAVKVGLN